MPRKDITLKWSCIAKLTACFIDNVEDLDVVIPM